MEISELSGSERRGNFRVSDSAVVDYRPLPVATSAEAVWQLEATLQTPNAFSLSSQLHAMRQESTVLRRHAQRESATFAKLVDQLNRKIEMLTEVLLVQEFGARPTTAIEVDVGADGLGMAASDAIDTGTFLDLRMLFRSTGIGLRVAASVVRCDPLGESGHSLGLNFHYHREADRELIVHHVLQRQAMLLRSR